MVRAPARRVNLVESLVAATETASAAFRFAVELVGGELTDGAEA